MAKYNEILTGRHNRFLTKLFSMKGPAPAPQLASDIQVSQPIFHGVENRCLESWDRFGVGILIAPTIGQTNTVQFRNPAQSNAIIVMEKLLVFSVVAQELDISVGQSTVDLASTASTAKLDSRTARFQSLLIASFAITSVGGLVGIIVRASMLAGVQYDVIIDADQEIPILPNQGLRVNETAANSQLIVSAIWRERALEESEVT